MEENTRLLSKENSLILRGLAILAIMYHNFLHNPVFGFCHENERTFVQEKANAFFELFVNPNFSIGFEFLSFLGWIGVPVFVFLTGYGLAVKYPPPLFTANVYQATMQNKWRFVKRNYLKLLFLLLPAMSLFLVLDMCDGAWGNILKRIIGLTMLNNLDCPHLHVNPGVYWYFSLTFQYYLLYCFCQRWFKPVNLCFLSVLSLLLLFMLIRSDYTNVQWIYRACFTGWFPLFALGICMAINDRIIKCIEKMPIQSTLLILAILSVLIVIMNANIVSWILLPIVSVFFFLFLSKTIVNISFIKKIVQYIGGLSAFVFVCHPIAREIVMTLFYRFNLGLYISLVIYTIITFFLAFYYKKCHRYLSRKYIC